MPFGQSTIGAAIGSGVIGERANSGPFKALPFIINNTTNQASPPGPNIVGKAASQVSEGIAQLGQNAGINQPYLGITCDPKCLTSYGNNGNPFDMSGGVANGTPMAICQMGSLYVLTTGPANSKTGDKIYYDVTIGALLIVPRADPSPGNGYRFAHAVIEYYTPSPNGTAQIYIDLNMVEPTTQP